MLGCPRKRHVQRCEVNSPDMTQNLCVGPYEFLHPLGSGGQGSVWLATDRRGGDRVAIKVLPPGTYGAVELGRLRRESSLLLTFSDPGLPGGIGLIEDPSQRVYGFVMQYVEGTALNLALRERILTPRQVVCIATELTRIVSVLHARGVVHRDVKMTNLLVRGDWENGPPGSIVLVDLGIARGLQSNAATAYTAPGELVGSAPYVAPELLFWTGEVAPSCAADVFALGVVIWLLLFKRHPTGLPMASDFQAFHDVYRSGALVMPDPARELEIRTALPGLLPILYRCLEFSLSRRFSNAMELHEALSRAKGTPSQWPALTRTVEMVALGPDSIPASVAFAGAGAAAISSDSPPPSSIAMAMNVASLAPRSPRSDRKTLAIVVIAFLVVSALTTAAVIWVLR
jgi:serine/threonine-protein kinase